MGILAFLSRSRNKTLIPGNSVCITLYTESHGCAQYTVKNTGSYAAATCPPATVGLKPGWICRQAGLGHHFRPPISFFPSPVKENKFWGSGCDLLNLLMPPLVSLLVNCQDAESITWPDAMLVTAYVIRSGAEWQTLTNKVKGRAFKQRLKQRRTSGKTENKQEAGYQKKNRITKCEEGTLGGENRSQNGSC